MTEQSVLVKDNTPHVRRLNKQGIDYLHFTFKNKFTRKIAESACREWSDCINRFPDRKFVHIWNCHGMTGFEYYAKSIWMNQMKKFKNQTEKIILISDNMIILGEVRNMTKLNGLHLTIYRDMEEMALTEMS